MDQKIHHSLSSLECLRIVGCCLAFAMPQPPFKGACPKHIFIMIESSIEVFMDDFLVFGNDFDSCLVHSGDVLERCAETNLVFNRKNSILWSLNV